MRANLSIQPPIVVAPMALPPIEMRMIRVSLAQRYRPKAVIRQLLVRVVRRVTCNAAPRARVRRRATIQSSRRLAVRAGPDRPRLAKAAA